MSLDDHLIELDQVLNSKGDSCDFGCSIEEYEAIYKSLIDKQPYKNVTAVRDWCWWDLKFPSHVNFPEDVIPAVVKGDCVLKTSHPGFRPGHWVRASFLVKFHQNCVFETKNTYYLLVGEGSRKTVEAEKALAFF